MALNYCKTPKNSDIPKNCCNHPKTQSGLTIMCPKSADGPAKSVDPD